MVHQIFVANHIEWELLNSKVGGRHAIDDEMSREKIRSYFQENYYRQFHTEIVSIMRLKLYLVEGSEVPESFYLYLKHAAQEHDQKSLWREYSIDSSFLKGEPWPQKFYDDIRNGFESAMRGHQKCIDGLKV